MEGAWPPWTNKVLLAALPTVCVVTRTESNKGLSTNSGCLFVDVELKVDLTPYLCYIDRVLEKLPLF
jgi:hypothetical protein